MPGRWTEAECLAYVERARRVAAKYGKDFYRCLSVDLATMPLEPWEEPWDELAPYA